MRSAATVFALLLLCSPVLGQKTQPAPLPTQFEIGRHTYFDFGPPFDYYEILIVRDRSDGAFVERITLTPSGDACTLPAKIEVASAHLDESVSSVLESNPCAIPERKLRHELKRRRKGLVFSGADVTMQVQCGAERRLIRSAILDRDWFSSHADTPEHTSWTMRLLGRLEHALGPGVMDKPMFPLLAQSDQVIKADLESATEQQIAAGVYDPLFAGAPDKPSDLYRASRNALPFTTDIALRSSLPVWPEVVVLPAYPPLEKAVRFRGPIGFTVDVDLQGVPSNVLVGGPAFLSGAVKSAVVQWRFPKHIVGLQVQGVLTFTFTCPSSSRSN